MYTIEDYIQAVDVLPVPPITTIQYLANRGNSLGIFDMYLYCIVYRSTTTDVIANNLSTDNTSL